MNTNMTSARRSSDYVLSSWVIYERPIDYPNDIVARKFDDGVPTTRVITGTLNDLRARFDSMGLVRIPSCKEDDACILETWL